LHCKQALFAAIDVSSLIALVYSAYHYHFVDDDKRCRRIDQKSLTTRRRIDRLIRTINYGTKYVLFYQEPQLHRNCLIRSNNCEFCIINCIEQFIRTSDFSCYKLLLLQVGHSDDDSNELFGHSDDNSNELSAAIATADRSIEDLTALTVSFDLTAIATD